MAFHPCRGSQLIVVTFTDVLMTCAFLFVFVPPPRYYVMRNHVVEKVLKLIRRKEKYLVVAAVRFLRTCVALKVGFVGVYLA